MTREEFNKFVEKTVDKVVRIAEERCGKALPPKYSVRWLGRSQLLVEQSIVEPVVQRVFVHEDRIYLCVDRGQRRWIWAANIWAQLDWARGSVRAVRGSALVEP